MKMDWQRLEEAAVENPNQFFDPMGRANERKEEQKLQKQFDKLCGPVTVRKIGDK